MQRQHATRREFIRVGAAAGVALSAQPAASYARVMGANRRIRIGQIGCGKRARGHAREIRAAGEIAGCDVAVAACCDIWRRQREEFPRHVEKIFNKLPEVYGDYRKLLEDRNIDAVTIATPDHQHCGQLIDAVNAGKSTTHRSVAV